MPRSRGRRSSTRRRAGGRHGGPRGPGVLRGVAGHGLVGRRPRRLRVGAPLRRDPEPHTRQPGTRQPGTRYRMRPPPGATPTGPPVAAAPRGSARVSAQLSAAGLVLQARARAVHDRDKAAWMATVADPASSFGVRQSLVFDNLMRLPVEGFTYDVPTPGPALTAARARALGPRALVGAEPGPLLPRRLRPVAAHVHDGIHLRAASGRLADRRRRRRCHHHARCGTCPA